MSKRLAYPISIITRTDNIFEIEFFTDALCTIPFDFTVDYSFRAAIKESLDSETSLSTFTVSTRAGLIDPLKKSVVTMFLPETEADKLVGIESAYWDLYIDKTDAPSFRPFVASKVTIEQACTNHV